MRQKFIKNSCNKLEDDKQQASYFAVSLLTLTEKNILALILLYEGLLFVEVTLKIMCFTNAPWLTNYFHCFSLLDSIIVVFYCFFGMVFSARFPLFF